jgi:multidrug efflux pump subunit AcrA (membrane-fusion protein)
LEKEIAMGRLSVGIFLLLLLVGCAQTENQPSPSESYENISIIEDRTISASGIVIPEKWANAAFLAGGKDLSILRGVSIGQEVSQDQLLATMNEDISLLNIEIAESQLESANVTLDQVENSDLSSDQDIELARIAVDVATAGIEQANLAWENTRLFSPIEGTVIEIFANPGEIVNPGIPIFLIADLDSLQVQTTDLSEVDVTRISVGNTAEVVFDALPDTTIMGKVIDISQRNAEVAGVYYTVTIELENIPEGLLWGMSAFAKIEVDN